METQHDITIEEIYLPSKHDRDNYLCEDFIIYPEGKEKNGGYIFGIIEIRATPVDSSQRIIKTIINTLKERYYTQINTSPDPSKLNLETVLEYALQKTNEALSELIQISQLNFTLENLHYLVAVAKPNLKTKNIDLHFTSQGLIHATLLHKTKQNNYKFINIVDNTLPLPPTSSDKIKFFSSTLSGKIYYHDALFISTEMFNNYIPPHKVNKILSNNELTTSINYFKNIINNVKNNSYLTYCAIFIKMEAKRQPQEIPVSQKSIDNLINTKEKTERFLTPTFTLNLKDHLFNLLAFLKRRPNAGKLHGLTQNQKLKFGFLKYIFNALKIIFYGFIKVFSGLFKLILHKKDTNSSSVGFQKDLPLIPRIRLKLFPLPKINKTIIIAIFVLVLVLISSFFWLNQNKKNKQERLVYNNLLESIKNDINNAKVSLIYKNDEESFQLIQKATEQLSALGRTTTNEQANFNELEKQITDIKNKLLKIQRVVPQLLAEVNENNSPLGLTAIHQVGTDLVVHGTTNLLYSVTENKEITSLTSNFGDIKLTTENKDTLLVLTNQSKIAKLTSGNLEVQTTEFGDNLNITNLALYGDNLYILDSLSQMIYKHPKTATGFGPRQNWLKNKGSADLALAEDIAIDGSIYVLTKDGTIYKFHAGQPEALSLATIEPKISDARAFYTGLDLLNIYLAADKRIIIFNKQGQLVSQLLFENLDGPITDLLVSDDEKEIFITENNKIYKHTLN